MEAKLRSISKRIPWSLAAKTLVFFVAGWLLPYGLFLAVAAGLYLAPFFKPLRFLLPFLVLLVLVSPFFLKPNFWIIALGSVVFFIISGVRELLFVERKSVYKVAYLILIFLLFYAFFLNFQDHTSWFTVFISGLVALIFFFLLKHLSLYKDSPQDANKVGRRKEFIAQGLGAFFMWQLLWVLLFLPLNYIYQSMLGFLAGLVLTELTLAYIDFSLTRRKILINFSLVFVFIVFILASFGS